MKDPTPFLSPPHRPARLFFFLLTAALALRAAAPKPAPAAPAPAEATAKPLPVAARGDKAPAAAAPAKTAAGSGVEVVGVHFLGIANGSGSANTWNETEIEINVKPAATKGDSRFVNRVKVTLTLAVENPAGVASYFRATAEAVALMEGRSKVRFYLPPEIVRRDTLRAEPKLYAVDLAAEGKPMAPARAASNAPSPAALAAFLKEAAPAAVANDGILVPQYLTPFAYVSERSSPTFVRPEAGTR